MRDELWPIPTIVAYDLVPCLGRVIMSMTLGGQTRPSPPRRTTKHRRADLPS